MFKVILFLQLFSTLCFADVEDISGKLSQELISSLNTKISAFEESHNSKLKIVILDSFEGEDPRTAARTLFKERNLRNQDILYTMSITDKASRFYFGSYVDSYSSSDIKSIHDRMRIYYQKYDYEGALNLLIDDLDQRVYIFKEIFGKKSLEPANIERIGFMMFGLLFLMILIPVFWAIGERIRIKNKYPGVSYSRGKQLESFQSTKTKLRTLLKKQYPDQSIYKSYRKVARDYKNNKSKAAIVNPGGRETDFSSLALDGAIPYYILMFNSPYTPLDFGTYKVKENGSTSSSCGTTSSGCSSSGCGGGGCGGGGCGS